ncbi:MAG: hypothetical protein QOF01_1461 [Thermomicrobiales bacterium]|nr:hypothetical protein [Thermomicrobiales bacterium]
MRRQQAVDDRRDVVGVADVAADRSGRAAAATNAFGDRAGRILTQVLDEDVGAGACQFLGDGGADAAAGTGDEGGPRPSGRRVTR